jgi:hypothetical protein
MRTTPAASLAAAKAGTSVTRRAACIAIEAVPYER